MSKKPAKTVSWRTLARRAEAAKAKGHKAAATRLRNMAAQARRDERVGPTKRRNVSAAKRGAKAWATRRANEAKRTAAAARNPIGSLLYGDGRAFLNPASNAMAASSAVLNNNTQTNQAPGLYRDRTIGEDADAQTAERIVKLARKKGGTDAVQNEITMLRATARYEGERARDESATEKLVEVQQIMADRIVCGFIAGVNGAEQLHRGLPPSLNWIINSFTITKIVDALNKAGYRANGKT